MIGVDDVTGEHVDAQLIWDARKEELQGFAKQEVYTRVPRWKAEQDPQGTFVGVRWVDRNKGTAEVPDVRSRLVAQEFASKDKEVLFAATPPLGAARALLSICASQGRRRAGHHQVMLLDVKKAFLYGQIQRSVYIELPPEDEGREGGQMMGLLDKAMYGLRDAPQVWQQEVRRILGGMGYCESKTSPCVYANPRTEVRIVTRRRLLVCRAQIQLTTIL